MSEATEVVTEAGLEAFRQEQLCPANVLALVQRHVLLLLRLPVGVGKTYAAQELLLSGELYRHFDLVVYTAPSWNILREVIGRLEGAGITNWTVLEPRPSERCGPLNEEWRDLEARGCAVLAKALLCRERCPEYASCAWPAQMTKERLARVRLILMTDQRLELIRNIVPFIQVLCSAKRMLVILDEARVLDCNFEVTLTRESVEQFRDTIKRTRCNRPEWPGVRSEWQENLERLLKAGPQAFQRETFEFTPDLHLFAYFVQGTGVRLYHKAFHYLGYDLSLLPTSRPEERWLDCDGFHFIARPYFNRHLLLLSAHLTANYAGHRLGRGPLPSPFEHIRFLHSGTRVINVRSSLGADRHFPKNHPQILDTFATLIARNIAEGRTTLLISRKKSKQLCASYLERRLRAWGLEVNFVVDGFETILPRLDPRTIPIIHYGILGVNDFTEYQCAYCLNSYYVNPGELNRAVQEFEPRHFRVRLEIFRGTDRMRRVKLADLQVADEDRTWLGGVYLRKLEVDPVIQAMGRVRFLTKPREVVFFQQNDLEREIGKVESVRSLAGLRAALDIPTASEIDHALEGKMVRRLLDQGLTAETAAAHLGISRATLFRRLEAAQSLRFPLIDTLRKNETPAGAARGGS